MHIAQYWVAVQECDDHLELSILALMALDDKDIKMEQSIELGGHIKGRREQLKKQGILFLES